MRRLNKGRLLSIAISAAKLAGAYLCAQALKPKRVDAEALHDLKLRVDKGSESIIVGYLRQRSGFAVLSEECGLLPGPEGDANWIVDPLDGTINYFRGIPFSCVSIALWCQGKALLGVVYDFNRDEIFSCIVAQGAYVNGRRIRVSSIDQKKNAILATGFPGKTDLSGRSIDKFARDVRAYKKPRLLGSAALSLAYVASGRFDAYAERDIMLWDVAGGIALIEAAGGKVRMIKAGHEYGYHVQACNSNFRM
ncbi:MAG: inositol monophosphatase [Candidatus Omnitrophica bacterium]|nr:inositol monophosphatase [Candidatus Omnitrophota bacterium]